MLTNIHCSLWKHLGPFFVLAEMAVPHCTQCIKKLENKHVFLLELFTAEFRCTDIDHDSGERAI